QRLSGQPPPFRRRHLCRSPQASQTGSALRRSASGDRLRFGPAAPRTQRTSRSKTSPKKLSTTYQTSQKNAHRTTPKPAQESILNVAYLSAIRDSPIFETESNKASWRQITLNSLTSVICGICEICGYLLSSVFRLIQWKQP